MAEIDLTLPFAISNQQRDFYLDDASRYPAFVSGFGGGKTLAACYKALRLCAINRGCDGIILAPSYAMIEKIIWPMLCERILNPLIGPKCYTLNKQSKYLVLLDNNKEPWARIWFYSADQPEQIVGSNVAWGYVDEAGLVPEMAWQNLNARIRDPRAKLRQTIAAFTPENPGWTHETWGRNELYGEPLPKGYTLYQGTTFDNWVLGEEFVQEQLRQWGEQDADSRVRGKFKVSRTGRAYYAFSRTNISANYPYDNKAPLWITFDFNMTPGMHSLAYQFIGGKHAFIHEVAPIIEGPRKSGLRLEECCMAWLRKFWDHEGQVYVTGDATGHASASQKGYYKIIMEHFEGMNAEHRGFRKRPILKASRMNPSIENRVMNVNRLLKSASGDFMIMINPQCKRLIVDLETLLTEAAAMGQKGRPYLGDHPNAPDKSNQDLSHGSDSAGYLLFQVDPLRDRYQRFAQYPENTKAAS